jgi:hypothetical protein
MCCTLGRCLGGFHVCSRPPLHLLRGKVLLAWSLLPTSPSTIPFPQLDTSLGLPPPHLPPLLHSCLFLTFITSHLLPSSHRQDFSHEARWGPPGNLRTASATTTIGVARGPPDGIALAQTQDGPACESWPMAVSPWMVRISTSDGETRYRLTSLEFLEAQLVPVLAS